MAEVDFEHSLCGSNEQTVQSPGVTCVTQFESGYFCGENLEYKSSRESANEYLQELRGRLL